MIKSVYIHIPFCTSICTYCDFPKLYKNQHWIDKYLTSLKQEIENNYQNEPIETLYIGGGTPSCLSIKQLEKLFTIIKKINITKNCEITLEANIEDLTEEKLKFLKNKINRLSIGVQSFNPNITQKLGRNNVNLEQIKQAKKYFHNINIDLIYDLNNQTINDLKQDIKTFLKLDIPHLSTYSLIIEPNTKLYIEGYQKKEENTQKEEYINKTLKENGYIHYEISNYAKPSYQSKHNLTYWNNNQYYGFGLGASGYINNIRYDNTRNINQYLQGNYKRETHILDNIETLQNEFILGFRKINGINKQTFKQKYNLEIKEINLINELLDQKLLLENNKNIYINPKYLYISNEILLKFLTNNLLKH